jgi:hypothetical protein
VQAQNESNFLTDVAEYLREQHNLHVPTGSVAAAIKHHSANEWEMLSAKKTTRKRKVDKGPEAEEEAPLLLEPMTLASQANAGAGHAGGDDYGLNGET